MGTPENATVILKRLPFIDSLRGFALFGVFGANLMIFSGYIYMTQEQKASVSSSALDGIVYFLEQFLVENKFMGLFSVLFGISFWLFLNRVQARGVSGTHLFYRRIGWLLLFGALHGWLLWCFDILRFYALWAILLPLFIFMPLRRLLLFALAAAVFVPALVAGVRGLLTQSVDPGPANDALALSVFSSGGYWKVLSVNWKYDWYLTNSIGQLAYQLAVFGRMLVGLYAVRAFNLDDFVEQHAALNKLLWVGALVGAIGNTVFACRFLDGARGPFLPFLRTLTVESGFLGLTLAYASGLALLFINPRWKSSVEWLAPLGQMALTAYLLQTVFGIWLFYGFMPGPRLMGKVGPTWLALAWVVGYAVQVGLAQVWMQRFRFGPAEWLWRTLTYWRVQSVKRISPLITS